MDKRRNMIVAVAVLLALIAGFAAFLFLKDSDESNSQSGAQTEVVVAVRSIPANTKAAQLVGQGSVKIELRPANAVPVDAVRSIDELAGATYGELVLVQDVPTTTTITRSLFANPGDKGASFNSALAIDEQLVTVPGGQLKSLTAGLLKPGDRVNMIVTSSAYEGAVDGGAVTPAAPSTQEGVVPVTTQTTGYMLQNIEVYAVGATTALPLSATQTSVAAQAVVASSDITFRVNSVQALKIVRAIHGGAIPQEIWLTLVSQEFGKAKTPAITNRSLLTNNFVSDGAVEEPSPAVVEPASTTTTTTSSAAKPADEK